MTAIADLSDLINKATGGNSGTPENLWFSKTTRISGVAAPAPISGRPMSLWTHDGFPSGGVVPTSAAIPTRTTPGGLQQTDPGGGREKFLYSMSASGLVAGTLLLYDRLLHTGGLDATLTTAQDVQTSTPTPALTRYTNGIGNIAWVEIYTIIGATARTISMSYVDQGGNVQSSSSIGMGGTNLREQTRILLMPVQSGDTGIQAVESVTLSATTGSVGNFGVTIGHPLAYVGIGAPGTTGWRDFTTGLPGIPKIETDACLAFLFWPNTTTIAELFGSLSMIES